MKRGTGTFAVIGLLLAACVSLSPAAEPSPIASTEPSPAATATPTERPSRRPGQQRTATPQTDPTSEAATEPPTASPAQGQASLTAGSWSSSIDGQTLTVGLELRNTGTAEAGHFVVRVSCLGVTKDRQVPGLPVDAVLELSFDFNIYAGYYGADRPLSEAIVDPDHEVMESPYISPFPGLSCDN